ncbi:Peptidoglycan O-acetyltransferase [Candidatus Methylobacter favarea]|uniref:Probable alginate O-acetylase n=1 Tax=Candidatus Methylobacter favarea TaxID=2707345 RepID=A0A8S0Y6H5_9GAMM|nr:MBOAT family protein [Candidatus Methylobacter favarea]CAA9891395.1 Peptidoglycan O-acetyltransferase [Candidatus Methylobacter favarea]
MLFNSYIFIFTFLPIVFFGFFRIGKHSHALASLWLATASLFFYGWWDVRYVSLLLGSVVFNYGAGYLIGHSVARQSGSQSKILLAGAITVNLVLLVYFKYINFLADNLNHFAGTSLSIGEVILPLGISFFTFTQIAFLVDTCQGKAKEFNFVHYLLFVTYFPHLIAGPVLHHTEMMPQFAKRNVCHINWDNVSVGLSIFVLGLAKKVFIADTLADFSTPIFSAVAAGGQPMLFEAWISALAYTLQLYFDFSAYSDMAIGLSLMFNVRLPMNFNSPYKATSIIEFWRRWHITLSRFLRDYLYIPLGGSRNGKSRRYLNLMITMLLGGLWHGAGWTYVIWGGLHGLYLLVNHAWRNLKERMGWSDGGRLANLGAGALTFIAVVVGWVFFRADSFSSAMAMLYGMLGINGISLPGSLEGQLGKYFLHHDKVVFDQLIPLASLKTRKALTFLIIGFVIAWGLPNMRQLFANYHSTCEDSENAEQVHKADTFRSSRWFRVLRWRPSRLQGAFYGVLFFILLSCMASASKSEFLYFQF